MQPICETRSWRRCRLVSPTLVFRVFESCGDRLVLLRILLPGAVALRKPKKLVLQHQLALGFYYTEHILLPVHLSASLMS